VSFERGIARVRPGEALVFCTDGILERRNKAGEFFGEEALKAVVHANLEAEAEAIQERIFGAALEFGDGRPWEDDATVVVVRRL